MGLKKEAGLQEWLTFQSERDALMKTLEAGRKGLLQVGEGAGSGLRGRSGKETRGCLEDELAEFDDPQAVDGKREGLLACDPQAVDSEREGVLVPTDLDPATVGGRVTRLGFSRALRLDHHFLSFSCLVHGV